MKYTITLNLKKIFLDKILFFIAKTIIHFVLRKYVDLLYLEIDLTRNIAYTKDYASIVYSDLIIFGVL